MGRGKLTPENKADIRARFKKSGKAYGMQTKLAKEFGVSVPTINRLLGPVRPRALTEPLDMAGAFEKAAESIPDESDGG